MSTDLVIEKKKTTSRKIEQPKKYKVVICNDDVTPMDFVVMLLVSMFRHSEQSAVDITMTVHKTGSGIAGIYSHEIAEQKTIDAIQLSRSNGWPLIIKVEEA
jgi:ATP-dependent Clp protease adaptor protein ClpS